MSHSDSKFFTNEPGATLYDRFKKTLAHTEYFDMLVGYFRASGFFRLKEAFEDVKKVRILIGLNIDKNSYDAIRHAKSVDSIRTHEDLQNETENATVMDIQGAEDDKDVEKGILQFTDMLKSGKIEIRAHRDQNIHAKVYIMRHGEDELDYGRVITGSSNFSEQGLVAQREFNVELKDKPDVDFALEQFEKLWDEGEDVTETYIDTILNKSAITPGIRPYDLYLKFLYEYFKDEIDDDLRKVDIHLPKGFMDLAYQTDAVKNAKRILEKYHGVFLADVVGLGKTFITAMLLQVLDDGQKLILCPPNLVDYWKETLMDFDVAAEVQSQYQIDDKDPKKYEKYKYVVIDEVHRFRNDRGTNYGKLRDLVCKGKDIILVSATPFNNTIIDIRNLLNLFMDLNHSPFRGAENLNALFDNTERDIKFLEKTFGRGSSEYKTGIKVATDRIRENILRPLMIRRTRTEIKDLYKEDIEKQNLKFPVVKPPIELTYEFTPELEDAFSKTVDLLKQEKNPEDSKFKYARYMPLLYLKKPADDKVQTQQRNIGYFMKMLLVKRLESSQFAFRETLQRFIDSYNNFIKMYEDGTIYLGRNDIFKYLETDDTSIIEKWVDEGKVDKYSSKEFRDDFIQDLQSDLEVLQILQGIWDNIEEDPKLERLAIALKSDDMKNKKVIIFTEAKDTADYLFKEITESKLFPKNTVFEMSGAGGKRYLNVWSANPTEYTDVNKAKREIEYDFNPKEYKPKDIELNILITTDVLSEGVNLHKSNIIMNYDLPWNPTRVMQRVGRVNRIGTVHDEVYSYNFFPTSTSDAHLGLKDNIVSKLSMFTNLLGDDNPLLEASEHVEQHNLAQTLYENVAKSTDTTEDEEFGFVNKYLQLLRDIRDKEPELYKHIKLMPKKVRSGVKTTESTAVLTFFRKGSWTDFVISGNGAHVFGPTPEIADSINVFDDIPARRLSLLEAIKLFECSKDTKSVPLPDKYFDLLARNKQYIAQNVDRNEDDVIRDKKSKNADMAVSVIKSLLKAKHIAIDDTERAYLQLAQNSIPMMSPNPVKKLGTKLHELLGTAALSLKQENATAEEKTHVRNKLFIDVMEELKKYEIYWRPVKDDPVLSDMTKVREIILSKCFVGE